MLELANDDEKCYNYNIMKAEIAGQSTSVFSEDFKFEDPFAPETRDPIYENALRPFDDDAVLANRLMSGSRLFRKYPEAQEVVDEALTSDDDASLLTASELLVEAMQSGRPSNEKPVGTLITFLTAANQIVASKNRLVGGDAPNDRANALAGRMSTQIAASIPVGQLSEYRVSAEFLEARLKELDARDKLPIFYTPYVKAKLIAFKSELMRRRDATMYAEAVPSTDEVAYSDEQISQDTKQISEMFAVIQKQQHYGLKLAYKNHELGGSLIFSPSNEASLYVSERKNLHHLMESPSVARIMHSKNRSFKTIKPKVEEMSMDVLGINLEELNTLTVFELGQDGELYADRLCAMPLRDIFVAQGKYEVYRRLQAGIIADYFDMTQPAIIVDRARREINGSAAQATIPGEPMEVFGRLLAPRIRYAREDTRASVAEQEAIDETPHSQAEAAGLQKLRHLGWHRRTLPEGWHASPKALALAAEYKVDLKPNQTFVKPHTRGNKKLGEVVGHILVNS
jgi:hypothetical protein